MINDYGKKHLNSKNQHVREKYDNAELEFDLIDTVADFGEYLQFINSQGINLYAGNFNLPQLGIEAIDPHPFNDIFKYGVYNKTIAIFCFKRDDENDLNFNYDNFWHEQKLKQLLEKYNMNNLVKDVTEFSEPEVNEEINEFEDTIKYSEGINPSNVHFDHRVPFTNDDFDDPYEGGYEPDGRDMAEIEAELSAEKNDKNDEPF